MIKSNWYYIVGHNNILYFLLVILTGSKSTGDKENCVVSVIFSTWFSWASIIGSSCWEHDYRLYKHN